LAKLIILSVVLVSFALPVWLAATPMPRRTLRRIQWLVFAYVLLWSFMCLYWYPTLVEVE
jgi:hypothetical protein